VSVGRFLQQAAAGNAGGATYVEDAFSTYLYDGANGSTTNEAVTVSNGIDLYNEGGLIWFKRRDVANGHALFDSQRDSFASYLRTEGTNTQSTLSGHVTANSNGNGFTLSSTGYGITNNTSPATYASWTFRKQPGFFDVVTYTGDGTTSKTVSHSLGSTPGMIVFKRTDSTGNWIVWHRSTPNGSYTQAYLRLNANFATTSLGDYGNSLVPTDSVIKTPVHSNAGNTADSVNVSGATYVAYLFAHDAQDFGTDSDESIIKCGSFTGPSATVNLGFEPQWLLIKPSNTTANWAIYDVMRGLPVGGVAQELYPNLSNTEGSGGLFGSVNPEPTGFSVTSGYSASHIYVAIRRPHKPASEFSATDLFDDFKYKDNTLVQTDNPIKLTSQRQTGGPAVLTDMWWHALRGTTYPAGKSNSFFIGSRLQGASTGMITNGTNAEPAGDASEMRGYDRMTGVEVGPNGTFYYFSTAAGNRDHISYYLRRAPGFFDVVAYSGFGSGTSTFNHNLGVAPELMIIKSRGGVDSWVVGSSELNNTSGWNRHCYLNTSDAEAASVFFNNASGTPTAPTATTFDVRPGTGSVNDSGGTYVAYLFATVPGISKVGSYSGTTGSNVDVNCGFTSGARFVLVKRTDSTGDWYVWDSARGIVAGNDGYLLLNSTAAEVTSTDYIDPLSSGFTITSTAPAALNASVGNYIFLAIA
jgi:hypothetical protein